MDKKKSTQMVWCDNCRFWVGCQSLRERTIARGECRRHAPRPSESDDGTYKDAFWLLTSAEECCGEGEEK
jgi:hypothetical protein